MVKASRVNKVKDIVKEIRAAKARGIGKEIRLTRKELELTQKELGEIFGVDEMTINRWENGISEPPAFGAIFLALKQLRFDHVLDSNSLLNSLDRQLAELDSQRERVKKERAKFEKSLKK